MSQFLALEWNSREIRLAVGCGRGQRAIIEHAIAIPWKDDESAPGSREQRIGQRIAQELDARGIGRPPTLVAIGRTSIELRQLQLPPAPDEDLPDMVRFQAAREFNEFDENWLLDFVPIDHGPGGPRTVLATAIAPAVIRQIESVCEAAGLKMQRLLLRPCAAASLLTRDKAGPPGQLRLLVDLLADEADLTAVLDGQAVFLRTTRLGVDPPPLPALLGEIRLTMAAVGNQLAGNKVEAILLTGQGPMQADLATAIQAELGIPAELCNPFAGLELGPALRGSMPDQAGRFAALLGILVAEFQQSGHAVDFLHPRRRIAAPSQRKKWIIAAAAAGLLLLGYLFYARIENHLLANQIDELQRTLQSLEKPLASAKEVHTAATEIGKWSSGAAIWLDQLYSLSESFPPAQDAMLGQLTTNLLPQGGSEINVSGWTRNAEVIAKMEERVRSNAGQVVGKTSREDSSMKNYSWQFDASVRPRSAKP